MAHPKRTKTKARQLAREGRTNRQISKMTGAPPRVVRKWTATERQSRRRARAVRMAANGMTAKAIAVRIDEKVSTVERWLSRPLTERPMRRDSGARHGSDTRRCARKMAELQDPINRIAHVLFVTPKTVRTWLREVEVADKKTLLPGGPRRQHDREAILRDVLAKDEKGNPRYTRAEIRKKYGCCHKFLSHLVNGRIAP